MTTDKVAENIVTPKQQVNILQTNSNLQNKQSLKNVDINNKNINSIIGIGSKKQMSKNKKSLKVMFLGGVGEIGEKI